MKTGTELKMDAEVAYLTDPLFHARARKAVRLVRTKRDTLDAEEDALVLYAVIYALTIAAEPIE